MEVSELIPHIESLVFASDKPLSSAEVTELINQAFGFMDEKIEVEQVDAALEGIVEKYSSEFYPFEVRQSGGGWQFLTKKEYHKTVAQLNGEKFLKRLSTAALETLAMIAYKQPVTKGEIEAIRGVSSDYAIQKLLEKELIVITGRNEKLPGHPLVYATSKSFMDYFGINSPEDLPRIKEVLADQLVQPTVVNHTDFEQSETLAVSDNGELVSAEENGDEPAAEEHAGDEAANAGQNNGETVSDDELSLQEEETVIEANGDEETATETPEDEAAVEDYITDEIFVAEDEAVAEKEVEEELKGADDLPEEETGNEDGVPDSEDESATDDNNRSERPAQP